MEIIALFILSTAGRVKITKVTPVIHKVALEPYAFIFYCIFDIIESLVLRWLLLKTLDRKYESKRFQKDP